MSRGLAIYRLAARALAHSALASADILAVTVRRSVASGEAVFPWSDLDYDLVITRDTGALLASVLVRHRLAKLLFPRTGQCFALTAVDLPELAALEPLRASLNRRCLFEARGPAPQWPAAPIRSEEAARRVVFWLTDFFPMALRAGNKRNQKKFYLEMANALGILEGFWQEPCLTLAEVECCYPLPAGPIYAGALDLATRASRLLGRAAPRLTQVHRLEHLILVPDGGLAPALVETSPHGLVLTADALDLLLATQAPWLWADRGTELETLGFHPPPRHAWIGYARRMANVLWLRGPGFFEPRNGQQERRLLAARFILEALAEGRIPAGPLPGPAAVRGGALAYYRHTYDRLRSEAMELQARARQLGDGRA